jgi:hypothetical protein
LRLNGSTSGYTEIDAPAVAGSNTLVLPTGNGSSGQFLQTNGSGALSWAGGGKILQVVETSYTTSASTTTLMPSDSTIPQNTEGTEILSLSITPTSSSNKLLIQVSLPFLDGSTAVIICGALFQDSTANALATGIVTTGSTGYPTNVSFTHYMTAGTASSTTFKVRYGPHSGTAYINRMSSGVTYGNVAAARLTIMEIAA